jgi:serine/threonine protein kinase
MSPSEQISDLLVQWEERRKQGHNISAQELCRDQPELLGEVQRRVTALEAMYRVPNGLSLTAATVSSISSGTPDSGELPRVSGYQILGVIGYGGMGVVYKALQVRLNRLVALKMILAGPHSAPRGLARFRSEAEAVALLQHPNIVRIHEVGEQDSQPFLALEFVEGCNLSQALTSTPLPPRQGAELIEKLARAIHYAHQRGIVHRDLKPANILLQKVDGSRHPVAGTENTDAWHTDCCLWSTVYSPKITDFGLAKRLDAGAGQTQSGTVLGTPGYMAPELAEGKAHLVGPRTDVYALGAILYEILTGRPPFAANSLLEVIDQVRSQDPLPPRSVQPSIPADLDTICMTCLRKDPEERYDSAEALADDLRRFLNGELIRARKLTPFGKLARILRWSREFVELHVLADVLTFFLPVPFLSHLLVFLLLGSETSYPAIALGTTLGNFLLILGLIIWLISSGRVPLTSPVFRQFWDIRIAQLSGMVVAVLLCWQLAPTGVPWQLTVYPFWAVLTGMTCFGLGSKLWGGFYLAGICLFVVAVMMPLRMAWAPVELGAFLSCFLTMITHHFRRTQAVSLP